MNPQPLAPLLVVVALLSPAAAARAEEKPAPKKDESPAPAPDSKEAAPKEAAPKESSPAAPPLEITLDTSEAPELAEWAAKTRELCEKNYAMILGHLGSEGFSPASKVKIVFKNMKGVAYTSGGKITCAAAWFKAHPDDHGAVIHELCHVVQAYGRNRVPGWVTEGIADYVRWFNYEPPNRRPRVNVKKAKHTDSYQTTAAFFDWIVRTKDKTFVSRLNAACRAGKYKPELFQEYAGSPVDGLWGGFIASLVKE